MKKHYTIITLFSLLLLFIQCKQDQNTSDTEVESRDLTVLGKSIVDTTAKQLKSALITAIAEGGAESALLFCKAQAIPLTIDLAEQFEDIHISRRAIRYRNPVNRADEDDMKQMTTYEASLKSGESPKATLKTIGDQQVYFHPILLQPECLTCHGSPEQVGPLAKTIGELYPDDRAMGFKVGELRGIWRVEFN